MIKLTRYVTPSSVVFVVLLFLWVYFQGKAKGKSKGYTRAPVDPSAVTPGFDPYPLAQKFANAFQGWNFWSAERREVLNDLWRLTDAELSLTYNSFQENFAEGKETMRSLIKGDFIGGEEVDRVINRFNQLQLP